MYFQFVEIENRIRKIIKMSKFANLEENLDLFQSLIRSRKFREAKQLLEDNYPILPETIINNSESSGASLCNLKYYSIGSADEKIAEEIFNMLAENIHDSKVWRVFGGPVKSWNLIPARRHDPGLREIATSADPKVENANWFIDVVLYDMLTSESPNMKLLSTMFPDTDYGNLDEMDLLDYYKLCMEYAREQSVDAYRVVSMMVKDTQFLNYFLSGNEYTELFEEYFNVLTETQKTSLQTRLLSNLPETQDKIVGVIYLLRRLTGKDCKTQDEFDSFGEKFIEIFQSYNELRGEYESRYHEIFSEAFDNIYEEAGGYDEMSNETYDMLRSKATGIAMRALEDMQAEIDEIKRTAIDSLMKAIV